MCRKKVLTGDSLKDKIKSGKIKIRGLNLDEDGNFNSALGALCEKEALARELDPKLPNEKRLIMRWLEIDNYGSLSKIAYLDQDKILTDAEYDNEILAVHLKKALQNGEGLGDLNVFQSLRNDIVIKMNFETKKGEEIVYRDKQLDIPVYLLAKLDLSFKIINPYEFIKFLDVNLQQINLRLFSVKVFPIICSELRTAVLKCIGSNNICYYELTQYYSEISKMLEKILQSTLAGCGLQVYNTYIRNTLMSSDAGKIFEEQRIKFMQKEKELELQHKSELMSLENYEKKAEIHSKYPSFEPGLTEIEKDNAIKRYLAKQNGFQKEEFKEAREINVAERNTNVGKVNKIKSVLLGKSSDGNSASKMSTNMKGALVVAVWGLLMLIVSFILLGNSTTAGLIIMAVAVALMGIGAARFVSLKKKAKSENDGTFGEFPAEPTSSKTNEE